ncbi:hypothetical protein [Chlorobaculum thiosulfatiphilum]|uniref:hypothetical protein n=1 Tax=Chlorobaculum thiosulfatiphilum TaxID=115852 RepID=UPI00147741FA|nr:hypothetical protein [Chlorobaculum thiosulfatiphilum]
MSATTPPGMAWITPSLMTAPASARIGKTVTARQKIAVGHIETRRDDAANIGLRRLAGKRIPPF